jgi:hypothetical protein
VPGAQPQAALLAILVIVASFAVVANIESPSGCGCGRRRLEHPTSSAMSLMVFSSAAAVQQEGSRRRAGRCEAFQPTTVGCIRTSVPSGERKAAQPQGGGGGGGGGRSRGHRCSLLVGRSWGAAGATWREPERLERSERGFGFAYLETLRRSCLAFVKPVCLASWPR